MKIQFKESEKLFTDIDVTIVKWRSIIQLTGTSLPDADCFKENFNVLNDEDVVVDYFDNFNVIYDQGEGFIQLTDNTDVYFNYLVTDAEGFVTSTITLTDKDDNAGYLYQSGQGKKFENFSFELFDESGVPKFKIVDDKLVDIVDAEKAEFYDELNKQKLEAAKASKVLECSTTCANLIESGVDVDIDGNIEHFSYNKEEDQINLFELFTLSSQTNVPMNYHPDGGSCKTYTTDQIIAIYATASTNKNHHTTYFNQIRNYILSLTTVEEVEAVQYGQDLTGKYLETYNASMAQAQLVLEALLKQRSAMLSEEQ